MVSQNQIWLPPHVRQQVAPPKKRKKNNFFTWTGLKTLKDWFQLISALLVPIFIAVGTLWFTAAQSQSSLQIANGQQQEAALQNYLNKMSDLLLNNNLAESKPGDEVREVARSRTLTLLPQLNSIRKREVVQFLNEAGLITDPKPVVSLVDADLSGANLNNVSLFDADLSGSSLFDANLEADLSGANLSFANLYGADLLGANLLGANLKDANLSRSNLSFASLSGAYLLSADLNYADLLSAHLDNAYLNSADLKDANLSGADLTGADLNYARDITNAQLSQAKSLKGASMPDGSVHP